MIPPILALKCPKGTSMDEFIENLPYPLLVTPKIDGIRVTTCDDINAPGYTCVAHTRSGHQVPNNHIRDLIEVMCPPWLDGELTCGSTFQSSTSGIMSEYGEPEFTYWVFDCSINTPRDYAERCHDLRHNGLPFFCKKLLPKEVINPTELLAMEEEFIGEGAEGLMARPYDSKYYVRANRRSVRASKTNPFLVAIKRFEIGEAVILSMYEEMHNSNPLQKDLFGNKIKRSSFQAGMVGKDRAGGLSVKCLKSERLFNVGTGFDPALRVAMWQDPTKYVGKIIQYKWQVHGTKNKPRIPVFIGFRDAKDL